jgi:alkanesulfonate monooxygenase SsuD/methylene tetrahydromethanopterin reductase-like flavin-dependent oxidoreductase (luciferase family)
MAIPPLDYEQFRRTARRADQGGFAFVPVGDCPAQFKDAYVSLAVLAASTSCRVGVTVTTPLYRDPLVTAAISSVESLAPGWVFVAIAAGRARAAAMRDTLRAYVNILRALWLGKTVDYRGESIRLDWDARPVPVFTCATGPRGLRQADEIANGVITESGVSEDAIERALSWIAQGAAAAGHDPDSIQRWWYLRAEVAETTEEGVEMALAPVAASGAHVLAADPALYGVPAQFNSNSQHKRYMEDGNAQCRHSGRGPDRLGKGQARRRAVRYPPGRALRQCAGGPRRTDEPGPGAHR